MSKTKVPSQRSHSCMPRSTRHPVVNKPVANKPVAGKPVANKPLANKPVANKPVGSKPGAGKHSPVKAQKRRVSPPPPTPGVSTPGLVGIGVVIGLTGHIVEQSRGEAWWSTQNAYAADAAMARQALLGDSAGGQGATAQDEAAPVDPDLDPRPPVLTALAEAGPEQTAVSFLDGLNAPTGLVIPASPRVERYLHHYMDSPGSKDRFKNWMRRGGEYDRMIESALRKHRVPIALKALVYVESAFQPEAVSPVGASGLWQFMEATARGYGLVVEPHYDQRFDPQAASNAAAKHLADLYEETKDWPLALAAYNYGLGNVRARLEEAGVRTFWELAERDDMLPEETRQYVPRILAIAVVLSNLEHYGLDKVAKAAASPRTTRYEPPVGVPLSLLARAAGTSTNQLLKLNPQLRKGELPGAGDPVTLNVKGVWYSRIQATLPLLMADGVQRRDLEVDADFDWGKDELVESLQGDSATAETAPLARELFNHRGAQQPEGLDASTPGQADAAQQTSPARNTINPAPILRVGGPPPVNAGLGPAPVQVPAEPVAAPTNAPGISASAGPLKPSPILSVSEQPKHAASTGAAITGSAQDPSEAGPERRVLPIRQQGQPNRLNPSETAQSFTPLGVTVSGVD